MKESKAITDIYYLTRRQTHSDKNTRSILTMLCALFGLLTERNEEHAK